MTSYRPILITHDRDEETVEATDTDEGPADNEPGWHPELMMSWSAGMSLLEALRSSSERKVEGEKMLASLDHFWAEAGRPRYILSDSAAALLAATKAPRASSDDIPVPHMCFVVEVPGAWTSIKGDGPLHVLVCRFKVGPSSSEEETADFSWEMAPLRTMLIGWRRNRHVRGLDRAPLASADLAEFAPFFISAQQIDEGGISPPVLEAIRYGLNTACLVTTYRETARRERLPLFKRDKAQTVFRVSPPPEANVTRQFRDHIRSLLSDRKLSERKQALMHVVRGHWKQQVVGAERAERKMVWIQPYKRGSQDLGQIVSSTIRIGHT